MRVLAILGVLMTGVLFWTGIGCTHDVRTVPIADEQMCLECGSRRRYASGEKPGHWKK